MVMEGLRRWLLDISGWNPSEHRFQSLLSLLPPQQQPQVTRFVKVEDRKRALVSRLLQYSLVTHVLGIPFDKISILRTTEGKPYLGIERITTISIFSYSTLFPSFLAGFTATAIKTHILQRCLARLTHIYILLDSKNKEKVLLYPNFNYSVSHHGDYVGVACEPICLVGFDIVLITKPQMETTLQYLNNFMPYFTPFEWDNIVHAGPSNNMLTEFYRYWCLKEAYVKAIGAGLGFGLNRLEFHHNNWTDIYLCIDGIRSHNWRFFIFELQNNHLACVAKGHPKEAIDSYQVTLTMDSFNEEEYLHAVEFPEPGFISLAVDQLVIQS